MKKLLVTTGIALGVAALGVSPFIGRLRADGAPDCPVSHQTLATQLGTADAADSTGLNNHYWAVVVNRAGVVCAVAFSGSTSDAQWLLSRQIAAAKAFTANGLSLDSAPISTSQLYPWVQPGAPANPLFGLAAGNPVDPEAAYGGPFSRFGTHNDPMVGRRVAARSRSAAASVCTTARTPSAGSACRATRRAPITPRRGGCATCSA